MTRSRAGFAVAATFVCALVRPSAALAEPARVLIESSCASSELDLNELLHLLRVELPAERVQVGATRSELGSPARPDLHVQLCPEGGPLERFSLRAGDAAAELRELDVAALPSNARGRALALALAEVIASAPPAAPAFEAPSAEPPRSPAARANEQPKAAAARSPPDIEPAASNARVNAAFATRAFALPSALDEPTWLYGPALGFDIDRWHLAAVLLLGRDEAPIGSVSLGSATGAAAYDVFRTDGDVAFAARVRGELGATWAAGTPDEGARAHSSVALAGSALFELALLTPIGGPWALDLRIASGYARGLGVVAAGSRSATTHGIALGLGAGLSWALP